MARGGAEMTKFVGTSLTRESDNADAFEGGGVGGATNLSIINRGTDTLDIASSSGADATVPAATASLTGLMSSADKAKLNGIGAGANVTSVAGQTGVVTLAPADIVGLGEFIDDEVAGLLVAGSNITLTYNDAANTLTIAALGGGGVTSVGGTGTVSGLTLTGTVTSTGNLTLGGTLAVVPSNFASQTANTFLAAPNGAAGVPSFRAIVAADIPTLNQSTTGSAATLTTSRNFSISGGGITAAAVGFNGSAAVTLSASVDAGHITLARMANLAANSFIGNNTGASATPIAMTGTQATALLDVFSSTLKGVVPASGGGTTNFLRADGTWAAPAGGTGTNLTYTASTRAVASSTGTGFTFPLFTSTNAGLVPLSGGGTTNFLRADGTWAAPAGGGGLTNNYTATSAPTASNDQTQGYQVGSVWLWAAIGAEWVCTSAATGAAVWVPKTTAAAISPSTGTRWTALMEGPITLSASSSTSANRLSLAPFRNYRRRSISELAARIVTGVAASNVALAIYAHDPATGFPTGSPICSTGSISSATSGSNVSSTISGGGSVTLEPGVYWMALWASAAGIEYQQTSMNNAAIMQATISGAATLADVVLGNNSAGSEVTCAVSPSFNPSSWPSFPATTVINSGFLNYVPFLYAKGV